MIIDIVSALNSSKIENSADLKVKIFEPASLRREKVTNTTKDESWLPYFVVKNSDIVIKNEVHKDNRLIASL